MSLRGKIVRNSLKRGSKGTHSSIEVRSISVYKISRNFIEKNKLDAYVETMLSPVPAIALMARNWAA